MTDEPVWPVAIRPRQHRPLAHGAPAVVRARPVEDRRRERAHGEHPPAPSSFEVTDTKVIVNNLRGRARLEHQRTARRIRRRCTLERRGEELPPLAAQLVTSTVSLATKDVRYHGVPAGLASWPAPPRFEPTWRAWRLARPQTSQRIPTDRRIHRQHPLRPTGRPHHRRTHRHRSKPVACEPFQRPFKRAGASPPPAPGTIWQEPRLTIRGAATYDAAADRLTFDQFQIQSNTLQATAAGQIEQLSTAAECNLNGTLNYDLAQVSPLLRPYLGEGIQLTGREQARFALAGKLSDDAGPAPSSPASQRRSVSTSATPQAASVVTAIGRAAFTPSSNFPGAARTSTACRSAPAELAATLGDGALRIEPLSLAVGEGQLNVAPNVRFDPEPSELTMPAGPVITNVRISPEVSEAMLKFVAPVLAGATQSEGQFSLQLDGLRVPLADTQEGRFRRQADRAFGPRRAGPDDATNGSAWRSRSKRSPSAAIRRRCTNRQPVTLLSIRDQQVNFRVVDGRVYHQNMEFQVGDVVDALARLGRPR